MKRSRKKKGNKGGVKPAPSGARRPSLQEYVPRFSDLRTNPKLPAVKPDALPTATSPYPSPTQRPSQGAMRALVRREMTIAESFSGPLPPPHVLTQYNQAAPDAANRILTMAEEQAQHRQRMEWFSLTRDSRRADLGLVVGAVVAISFLGGSVWLGLAGHDWLAGILGGATIVSLVTVFVTGSAARRNERLQKAEIAGQLEHQPAGSRTPTAKKRTENGDHRM